MSVFRPSIGPSSFVSTIVGMSLLCAAPTRAQEAPRTEVVTLGAHQRVPLPREVQRLAVGDESVLTVELLDTRQALALGQKAGSTTLLIWYADGTHESVLFRVRPDLSLLEAALRDIAPEVSVDMAPDRDAVVLRGTVPDELHRQAVLRATASYLSAVPTAGTSIEAPATTEGGEPSPGTVRVSGESDGVGSAAIIDMLRLAELPTGIESRILEAIRPIAGDGIQVRRVQRSPIADDQSDILVLEGAVEDQITLVRAMQLAARLFVGEAEVETSRSAIEVIADEAGGLVMGRGNNLGQQGGQGQGGRNGGQFGGGGGQGGGFAGAGGLGVRTNQVQRNLGRATVLSMARGRILSFVEIRDKPQVRVAVQVFEIDRDQLFQFATEIQALVSDFPQPNLGPSDVGSRIQPNPANVGAFSDSDVQAGLASLADGFGQQLQISGRNFALSTLLRALEARGIARRLSSPVLTVLNGETAQFQVGGEIPVPQAFTPAAGAGAGLGTFSSVDFRSFGVGLGVRPLVGLEGEVTIDLSSVISQPDEALTTIVRGATGTDLQTTAFSTRALQTNARLEDGQSLLVGGLVSRSLQDDVSKTPVLGDLPLVGWMFRSTNDAYQESELFVLVTPSIVRPAIPGSDLWLQPGLDEILGNVLRKPADSE